MTFKDRIEAGTILAVALKDYQNDDTVIVALPRGGVVLGAVIAENLKAPLGTVLVRKIGHPNAPEYAIGAVAEGNTQIFNAREVAQTHKQFLDAAKRDAVKLIEKRRKLYYANFEPPAVNDRTVILVDDGIATGLSMRAAVKAMQAQGAKTIIVAVPVAPWDAIKKLERLVDTIVLVDNPENFHGAVGAHFVHFDQVDDQAVQETLTEVNSHNVQHRLA